MSHRVITGSAKGRKLKLVPGNTTRPIMDRVKEALFSILGDATPGCRFLDLFAGTGAVGIEALSRGAENARFLDNDRAAIQTIHENLAHTGLADRAEVLFTDTLAYLNRTKVPAFDIAYIAPPQYHETWKRALAALDRNPVHLNPDALVIVQIDPTEYEALEPVNLEQYDARRYGNTMLVFYEFISGKDSSIASDDPPDEA
jgi:16S rRNA (guanine966-N2)-methyltransferase